MGYSLRAVALAAGAVLAGAASSGSDVRFKVASVAGGTLTAGGKPVPAGAEVPEAAPLHLDAGHAVIDLAGEGRLLLTGPADVEFGARQLTLTRGKLLSVVNRLKGRFSVATPVAVAAVRGTEFFVEAREDGRTYLCLCEGRLDVTGAGGISYHKTLQSTHHTGFIYSRHGKALDRNPWRMEHHSDVEIEGMKP